MITPQQAPIVCDEIRKREQKESEAKRLVQEALDQVECAIQVVLIRRYENRLDELIAQHFVDDRSKFMSSDFEAIFKCYPDHYTRMALEEVYGEHWTITTEKIKPVAGHLIDCYLVFTAR